jgi:ATP-dependent Clp protease, protease subunit
MKFKLLSVFMAPLVVLVLTSTLFLRKPSNDDSITLTANNTVVLAGEINGDSVSEAIHKAKELDNKFSLFHKPIYLFLNTPGGVIQEGLTLIEALNGLDRPVSTVTLFSASMGFQIVQNLNGERLILKNGVLMSHRAAGAFEGSFGGQKPSQVESRYTFWYNRIQELDEQTVKRTKGKQTLESYQKAYADELWLSGTQSVKEGYADRIVTVKCDCTLDGILTHSISIFGITVKYDLARCPINSSPTNIRLVSPDGKNISTEMQEAVKNKFQEQYSKITTYTSR